MGFLDFYGRRFDFQRMGLAPCLHHGSSTGRGRFYALRTMTSSLVMSDPLDPLSSLDPSLANNVGRGIFAMYRIKAAFHYALLVLSAPCSFSADMLNHLSQCVAASSLSSLSSVSSSLLPTGANPVASANSDVTLPMSDADKTVSNVENAGGGNEQEEEEITSNTITPLHESVQNNNPPTLLSRIVTAHHVRTG